MASAKSAFLLLLVVVASTVLQLAQANTVLLRGTPRDTLPRRNLLQVCPEVLPGIGNGPVAAKNVTAADQKCFISVIQAQWQAAVKLVPNLSAKLSRMQFHDAATGAQDASLALSKKETEEGPNQSVRGIEALKLFKDRIFKDCRRTISWADTLVLATAIGYERAGGRSMASLVPLGRGDNAAEDKSMGNLPGPDFSVDSQLSSFKTIFGPKYRAGDALRLMVTLEGAHSLGTANCDFARTFATAPADIEPNFLAQMQKTCNVQSCPSSRFPLDSTNARFDNGFFRNVIAKKGVFVSDHSLFYPGVCAEGVCSRALIRAYASNQGLFLDNFKWAFCHLSIIGTTLTCPPSLTFQDPIPTR